MALGKNGSSVLEPPDAVGDVPPHHLEVGVQQRLSRATTKAMEMTSSTDATIPVAM